MFDKDEVRVRGGQVLVIIVCLAVWETVTYVWSGAEFFLGSPSSVGEELLVLVNSGRIVSDMAITGAEAAVGFVVGTMLGSFIGLALWYSETVARIAKPFVLAIGAVPAFAFAPLLIVWFGIGFLMKAVLAIASTLFVSMTQAYRGAMSVSEEFVYVLRVLGADRTQVFRKVVLPGSLDWVLGSLKINAGFALLGAFIGEYIAAEQGIGHLILRASSLYNVPRALAGALGLVVLAIVFDRIAVWLEARRYTIAQMLSTPKALWP